MGFGNLDLNWEKTQIKQWFLFGLLLILIWIVGQNFVLRPERLRQESLRKQVDQLQKQIQELDQVRQNQLTNPNSKDLAEREIQLNQLLPLKWNRGELLKWVSITSDQSGLVLEEQSIEQMNPSDSLETLKISLKLSGRYAGFQTFLSNLNQSPHLLIPEQIQIHNRQPAEYEPKLAFHLILLTYKRLSPEE